MFSFHIIITALGALCVKRFPQKERNIATKAQRHKEIIVQNLGALVT
jgi:hypothetical protein